MGKAADGLALEFAEHKAKIYAMGYIFSALRDEGSAGHKNPLKAQGSKMPCQLFNISFKNTNFFNLL